MSKIFRKVALERLSSPEQLDQLMQVTDPRGWLALIALLMLLATALVWGFMGTIPTEAAGEGILIRRGGVSDLVSTGNGPVEEMLVAVGDVIEKDQPVATIRQESLLRQIEDTEARKEALEREFEDLQTYAEEQRRLSARDLAQQRANLERSIATLERELEILQNRRQAQQDLLKDGLITEQTLLQTDQQLNTTRDQIASYELELNGLELKRLEADQRLEQQLEARRSSLRDIELQLRETRASLQENISVKSPYGGRVLELMVDRGDVVNPGTPILSLEVVSEELIAVLFVPAAIGKQVQPGMEARISPANIKREEYGFMIGEVNWAAEFPSTSRGMRRLLANDDLVNKLMLEGPPIQIDISLIRDAQTPTGFQWSSSRGPDLDISSGTLTSGSIVVKSDRPISLVIPKIRKALGV